VKKVVVHTNQVEDPHFGLYNRCNFRLRPGESGGDLTDDEAAQEYKVFVSTPWQQCLKLAQTSASAEELAATSIHSKTPDFAINPLSSVRDAMLRTFLLNCETSC